MNILFAVDGDLRRGKHTDIRAAAFGYLEEAVVVYRRHDKTYLIYMSVEQDMSSAALKRAADAAERAPVNGHIFGEHLGRSIRRTVLSAGNALCVAEPLKNGSDFAVVFH